MQVANDGASGLEYKPFGLVRFVCGSSVLLLLLRVRAVDQQTLAVFVYRSLSIGLLGWVVLCARSWFCYVCYAGVRAGGQQTLAVSAYLPPLRSGMMMRASPGDRGRGGEMGLLARRARFVWLALLVVAVALPGAVVAQNAPAAAGYRSSFGSQLRNLK